MARLRLGYTKSRTGCLRCKQRRVKCDEHRPCRACLRHGVECSLLSASSRSSDGGSPSDTTSTTTTSTTTTTITSRTPPQQLPVVPNPRPSSTDRPRPIKALTWRPSNNQPLEPPPSATASSFHTPPLIFSAQSPPASTPDPFPYFAKFITGQPHDDNANWVSDLELLHHFTTSTSQTLLQGPRFNIWRNEVPKQAFVHVFLLHQILATAAFHLAYLRPHERQKYYLQASQHQSVAIQGVRAALTDSISSDNCHALFAASSLFFVGALAASRPDGYSTQEPTVDDLIDIFLLVKGIGGVLYSSEALLLQGPFAKFFDPGAGEGAGASLTLNRVTSRFGPFQQKLREAPITEDVRSVVEAEIASFISCIHRSVSVVASPEYRIVAAWPIAMSDPFITLLRQRNQVALALLSYYCVVMHATESGYWFTQGWSLSIAQAVSKMMEPPWDEDFAWALGWITGHTNER